MVRQILDEPAEEQAAAVIRIGDVFGFRTWIGSTEYGHDSFTDNIALAWVPPSDTGSVQLWRVSPAAPPWPVPSLPHRRAPHDGCPLAR